MARLPYEEKYKSMSVFDFPKLQLKKAEKARILLIEESAVVEYRHWAEFETGNDLRGYYVCIGDHVKMAEEGHDENCGFCVEARLGSPLFKPARRCFVTHIVRYRSDAKGVVLQPISVEILLWIYADDKYNSITSKRTEWGDLRKHDLVITCTREKYQTMEIEVAKEALWQTDEKLKTTVVETYKKERKNDDDLMLLIGRKLPHDQMQQLIAQAKGIAPPAETAVPDITGDAQPADILGDLGAPADQPDITPPVEQPTTEGSPAETYDFDDLLNI